LFVVASAAKAAIQNSVAIAAVNRCATQKRSYRGGETAAPPKIKSKPNQEQHQIPGGIRSPNPTLAQRTRKDGAPALSLSALIDSN
jgi:hypothetical protein